VIKHTHTSRAGVKGSVFAGKSLVRWASACLLVLVAGGAHAQLANLADSIDEAARRAGVRIFEFSIPYTNTSVVAQESCVSGQAATAGSASGSTHEITFDHNGGNVLWVTGQTYDTLVKVQTTGSMSLISLPSGSGPHGIDFDAAGHLWVTLELAGKIARVDDNGAIVAEYDVSLNCTGCATEINTHPHGLGIDADGQTVWFTGKATGTVGKITPTGEVLHYALKTVGSVPIYIKAGPDGNMWVTELVGNAIARVTPDGVVSEFPIPTFNSRPIAIVPDPNGNGMWFSEEAGNKVARIDLNGSITEFPLPRKRRNYILAGLAFDNQGNLWVQQYVDQNNPLPKGPDFILKIDKSILTADPSRPRTYPVNSYPVPTRQTVMHRIIQGPDGAMWFTELAANKVGKLVTP